MNVLGATDAVTVGAALLAAAVGLANLFVTIRTQRERWRQDTRVPIYLTFLTVCGEFFNLVCEGGHEDDPAGEPQRRLTEARNHILLVGPQAVADRACEMNNLLFFYLRNKRGMTEETLKRRYRTARDGFLDECHRVLGFTPVDRPDDELAPYVAAQREAVARRVQGGPYEYELDLVDRAETTLRAVVANLALGPPRGSVTPRTGKPQFLLRFHSSEFGPVVLKAYGSERRGEAAALRAWAAAEVPAPRVLADGHEPHTWLLLPYLACEPPPVAVTDRLAAVLAKAHAVPVPVETGPSPADGVGPHLAKVTACLVEHGYGVPDDWEEWSAKVYGLGGEALLHGDLTPENLAVVEGRLTVFDACGYVGAAEFDAARWCVRTASQKQPLDDLLAEWLRHEPGLDPTVLRAMVAVESLMEAGVTEIRKREQRLSWADRDPKTERHLADVARFRA